MSVPWLYSIHCCEPLSPFPNQPCRHDVCNSCDALFTQCVLALPQRKIVYAAATIRAFPTVLLCQSRLLTSNSFSCDLLQLSGGEAAACRSRGGVQKGCCCMPSEPSCRATASCPDAEHRQASGCIACPQTGQGGSVTVRQTIQPGNARSCNFGPG